METSEHTVELFSGPKLFSSLAAVVGYSTFTVDRNGFSEPNLVADVRSLSPSVVPARPLLLWSAPPDAAFNASDRDAHWDPYGTPLTAVAEEAIETFRAALTLTTGLQPKWWFIENPYGPLRNFTLMAGFNRGHPTRNRITIDHADYGDYPHFRTDIWTNAFWWHPRSEAVARTARRPADAPVQVVPLAGRRLPPAAIAEMLDQLDAYRRAADKPAALLPKLDG